MKRTLLLLLVLLLAIPTFAFAESLETTDVILATEALSETAPAMQSVTDFDTESEYPYETVGYFLENAVFMSENILELTITFTGDYGSNEYFSAYCYIPVYNYETEKLMDVFYSNVELKKPFATSSRTSIKRQLTLDNVDVDIFKIKVIMLESLETLRPNCPVPYRANELVIAKNDINKELPTATVTAKIQEISFDKSATAINLSYGYNDIEFSDAAVTQYGSIDQWKNTSNGSTIFIQPFSTVKINGVDLKPLVGLKGEFLIDLSDFSNPKLISAQPKEGYNTEVVLDPKLIENKNNNGYVEYYKNNDATRTSKLKLEYNYGYIGQVAVTSYINLAYTDYNSLYPNTNSDKAWRYVDTDNDGDYDTLFVDREEVFVVGSVNLNTNKIIRDMNPNAMSTMVGEASITLDPEDESIDWSIKDASANVMDISQIQAGDVAVLKRSTVSDTVFYDITIHREEISGIVTETYTEVDKTSGVAFTKYILNGEEYGMLGVSDYYIYPGDQITAKVYDGKIVSFTVDTNVMYGMILANNVASDFSTTYQVQVMNQAGSAITYNLAEKVNGSDYSGSNFTTEFPKGAVIAYELNANGEISKADVYAVASNYSVARTFGYGDVLGNALNINVGSGDYNATSQKIGSYYLTEDSVILTAEPGLANPSYLNKYNIALASEEILEDDRNYEYSVVYNDSKEIQFVIFYGVATENPGADAEISDEVYYGTILATNIASDFNTVYQVQLVTQNGEIITYNLADKLNGSSYNPYSSSYFSNDFPKGSLIAYQLNSNGEIARADIAGSSLNGDVLAESSFVSVEGRYNAEENSFLVNEWSEITGEPTEIAYKITNNTYLTGSSHDKEYVTSSNCGLVESSVLNDGDWYDFSAIANNSNELIFAFLFDVPVTEVSSSAEILEEVHYGMILANNVASDFSTTYQVQLVNQEGTVFTYNLAEKVNGADYRGSNFTAEFPKGAVIAYRLNTNQEIAEADVYCISEYSDGYTAASVLNGGVMGTDLAVNAGRYDYNATSQTIGDYSVTNSTVALATDCSLENIARLDKTGIELSSSTNLIDDESYEFAAIINNAGEVQFIVLYETLGVINYNQYPLIVTEKRIVAVDDENRVKYIGYVNGEKKEFIVSADPNGDAYALNVNDIAIYCTNAKGEFSNARKLASYNYGGYTVAENYTDTLDEDNTFAYPAVSTLLNTRTYSLADQVQRGVGSAGELKGLAYAGKAYNVTGRYLQIISDYVATEVDEYGNRLQYNYGYPKNYDTATETDGLLEEIFVNPNQVAYYFNARTGQVKLATLGDLETDVMVGANMNCNADNDDMVYIYNYGGQTKLILIIDAQGDNGL